MKRWMLVCFATLSLLALVAGSIASQSASAQSDGAALCASALAAANGGATSFQGYRIVRSPAQGGSGAQVILGTDGPDRLDGGSGDDLLCGFGGGDTLSGGSGNDILVGGPGADALLGGSNDDRLFADAADVAVDGGSGANQINRDAEPPTAIPLTGRVVFTIGPYTGAYCDLTATLLEAQDGTSVRVFATTSSGNHFRPILTSPGRVQDYGFIGEGVTIVSATAEVANASGQGTGVYLPTELPTTPCSAPPPTELPTAIPTEVPTEIPTAIPTAVPEDPLVTRCRQDATAAGFDQTVFTQILVGTEGDDDFRYARITSSTLVCGFGGGDLVYSTPGGNALFLGGDGDDFLENLDGGTFNGDGGDDSVFQCYPGSTFNGGAGTNTIQLNRGCTFTQDSDASSGTGSRVVQPTPVTPTAPPITPPIEPVTVTAAPITPTAEPVTVTAAPITPTAEPVVPTGEPITPTAEPAIPPG